MLRIEFQTNPATERSEPLPDAIAVEISDESVSVIYSRFPYRAVIGTRYTPQGGGPLSWHLHLPNGPMVASFKITSE